MAPHRPLPAFLSTEPSDTVRDRPLREEEFVEVWAYYAPATARLIRRAVGRASLHQAAHLAAGASAAGASLLASSGAARRSLQRDDAFQEDILQDVALHFWRWTKEGRLRASAPFIWRWLEYAVRWITRAALRQHAVLVFAAGGTDLENEEEGCLASAEAIARFDSFAVVEGLLVIHAGERTLGPLKRTVLRARLDGYEAPEIARRLGLTAGNVRVLLSRGLRTVVALLMENLDESHGKESSAA
jgi:DNA-directed RNA polymerase specialized sigma24 family protein